MNKTGIAYNYYESGQEGIPLLLFVVPIVPVLIATFMTVVFYFARENFS